MRRENAEISKRNPYYISRERYMELRHFCLQCSTPIIFSRKRTAFL